MLRTIAVFLLLSCAAYGQYGIARKVVTGTGSPPTSDCDAANEVGNVYARTNGAAAYATFYVCGNTAASTYAWELYSAGGSVSLGAAGSLSYYATTGTALSPLTTASGILTWLTTPSSSNLRSAVTDETGTGALVFGTSPTLTTPALGTPSAIVLTNGTGLPAFAITGQFATNAQTSTYQVLAADFTSCKTIIVASGTFTITLVASGSQPADGACITVLNYGTGVVTLARSGQNINGAASNLTGTAGSATAPTGWRVYSNGSDYFAEVIGGGGSGAVSSVTAGASGALTISPTTGAVVGDADTAYVPGKTTSNTWTGVNDFSGATRTAPMKVGTSDPGTCTVGDFLFRSDTGTTKACTATNTWTAVGSSGGGTVRTTYAALPTCNSSTANYQYVLTDSIYTANCNGSSYAYWTGQKYIPTLPWSDGTTFGTGATVTATTGSVLFDAGAPTGGDSIRAALKSIPTAPYTIILDIDMLQAGAVGSSSCGLVITNGTTAASDDVITLMTSYIGLNMTKLTNATSWDSNYIAYAQATSRNKMSFRLVDDNTNRTWSVSQDRINWTQVSQQSRTDFLTATHYGYGCNMTGVSGIVTAVIEGVYAQ